MIKRTDYEVFIPCIKDTIHAYIPAINREEAIEKAKKYFAKTIYSLGGLLENECTRLFEPLEEGEEGRSFTLDELMLILSEPHIEVYEIEEEFVKMMMIEKF